MSPHAAVVKLCVCALQLGLPVGFHLYLVPQSLAKFHPSFDAALLDILNKVRAISRTQSSADCRVGRMFARAFSNSNLVNTAAPCVTCVC
jgi:hypothetical protein